MSPHPRGSQLGKVLRWGNSVLTPWFYSNLMAPDEFRNLGFADEKPVPIPKHAGGATMTRTRDDGKKI